MNTITLNIYLSGIYIDILTYITSIKVIYFIWRFIIRISISEHCFYLVNTHHLNWLIKIRVSFKDLLIIN